MEILQSLTSAMADTVAGVQRSLVVLQNGRHGFGAGLVWRPDGVILTNNHVVGRSIPHVFTADGREFSARLLARDEQIDLALLKFDADDLPAARVADSRDLKVGQLFLAVGHPWGEAGFVTLGCISSLGAARTNDSTRSVDIIRSDVRLAPGNSGGPLVNLAGEVVGINTMIVGGDQGIALPSYVVSQFVEETLR